MTNHTMRLSVPNLKVYDPPHNEAFCNKLESVQYNATLAITQSLGQSMENHKLNPMLNSVLNLSRQDTDSEDCAVFINLNPMGLHHIFFSWYLKNPICIYSTCGILRIFERNIAEQTHLKTPFFHGPLVSGINLI